MTASSSIARTPLLGRRFELAELCAALDEARAGHGRLFLLSGDAGIGKTRVAEALADAAEPTDARVRWGCCWEGGGAPPYWPWTQVLGAELADLEDDEVAEFPHAIVSQLALLVPELARRFPDVSPLRSELPAARAALFDAVSSFLGERSGQGGLVVILDDLHAADTTSLKLLQFLVRDIPNSHLLVVGTYRDPEVRSSPTLHQLFTALSRQGRKLTLMGLDEDNVASLLEQTTGSSRLAQLARHVHHTTDGNPFFVQEVGRVLVSERRLEDSSTTVRVPVPEEVHALIRRRLEPLGDQLRQALTVAALLGREFDVGALAAVLGQPIDAVLDVLAEARRLDVVDEAGLHRFRFSHALLGEALYDELRPSERVSLHRRATEVLERLGADAAQLAHHSYAAARGGDGTPAVQWCTTAGAQAMVALAFEEAGAFYGRALEALALTPPVDEGRRYELLVALAEAQKRTGDLPLARDTYQRALKCARALGAPELLARAAIGYTGYVESVPDDSRASVLEEALAALPPADSPLRARLLVLLAHRLQTQRWATPESRRRATERARELGRQAVAMARKLGDPETLRAVLWEWHFTESSSLELFEERLAVADELVELAITSGDRQGLVLARQWRASDLFALGDIPSMAAELDAAASEAESLRMPFLAWGVAMEQAGLALHRGQLDEAETHARRALAISERSEFDDAEWASANQWAQILYHRGEWGELEAYARLRIDKAGPERSMECWWMTLGLVAAHRGDRHEARRVFADWAPRFPALPGPPCRVCLARVSELAWATDATDGVDGLYQLFVPYAGRHLVVGVANASLGAADRHLAQLATLLGRFDEAERHFQAAHRLHARLGTPLWDAYTLADHARMLQRRDQDGDRQLAGELADAARKRFREMGMTFHDRQVEALFGGAPAAPVAATSTASATTDRARLSQEGEYWAFEYGAEVARLRDSKGLRYLAHLLRNPGREHHALDLVVGDGAAATRPHEPELARSSGDAGVVLDAKAKSAYRARLQELREELDEANAHHDLGRADRAQSEMDFLLAELAGAVGLGGRDRRAASDAERARQSVTRAIKGAVERLAEAHPSLGDHLRSTVRTGIYSAYAPDPRAPILWEG